MDRTPDGGWALQGMPLIPPPWWVDRLNAARRAAGQPEVGRYSSLAMTLWPMVMAPPPPRSLVHISGI